eukprot:302216_1
MAARVDPNILCLDTARQYLSIGYCRQNNWRLITDIINVIAIYCTHAFQFMNWKNRIEINGYPLIWIISSSGITIEIPQAARKTIKYLVLYFEIHSGQSTRWRNVISLDCNTKLTDTILGAICKQDDTIHIVPLLEKIKPMKYRRITRGITMNLNETYQWSIDKEILMSSISQICSPTFGRSQNWFLTLEKRNADRDYRLYLNLLMLPTDINRNGIKDIKSVRVNCDISVIGLNENVCDSDSFQISFGYGDKTYVWRTKRQKVESVAGKLTFELELSVTKAYTFKGKCLTDNECNVYGII